MSEFRQKGVEALTRFVKYLDEKNIIYWVDYGTLLGAIRHESMLSWDGEFDISMWKRDFKLFSQHISDLEDIGFEVEYYRNETECTNIKLFSKNEDIGVIPIDIHFYETDKIYASRLYGPFPKNKFLDMIISFTRSNSLIKRFSIDSENRLYEKCKYSYNSFYKELMKYYEINAIEKIISKRKFYFVQGKYNNSENYKLVFSDFVIKGSFEDRLNGNYLKNLFQKSFANLSYEFLTKLSFLFNFMFNKVQIKSRKQIKIAHSIFSSFIKVPFEGIEVNAPKEFSSCLEVNYGDDWKTPKSNWDNTDRKKLPVWNFYK